MQTVFNRVRRCQPVLRNGSLTRPIFCAARGCSTARSYVVSAENEAANEERRTRRVFRAVAPRLFEQFIPNPGGSFKKYNQGHADLVLRSGDKSSSPRIALG